MPQQVITVGNFDPGGVGGIVSITRAAYIEEQLGLQVGSLFDLTMGASIGSLFSTTLKIPHPQDSDRFQYSAKDITPVFYECATQQFGDQDLDALRAWQVISDLLKGTSRLTYDAACKATPQALSDVVNEVNIAAKRIGCRIAPQTMQKLLRTNGQSEKKADRFSAPLFDQSILGSFLQTHIGDHKVSDLMHSHILPVHRADKKEEVTFGKLDPRLFNMDQWSTTEFLGDDLSLTDVILRSTAAPTVFPAIAHGDDMTLLDFGMGHSVAESIRDLDWAARSKNSVFHVLCFGTGYDTSDTFCREAFNMNGPLLNMQDLTERGVAALKKRIKRSVDRDFKGRLHRHTLNVDFARYIDDIPLPKGMNKAQNLFCGQPAYLDWMQEVSMREAMRCREDDLKFITRMQEAREQSRTVSDSTAAYSMPKMSWGQQERAAKPFCVANENKRLPSSFEASLDTPNVIRLSEAHFAPRFQVQISKPLGDFALAANFIPADCLPMKKEQDILGMPVRAMAGRVWSGLMNVVHNKP